MTAICDVCDEPAEPTRPLLRVYDLAWSPMDVHEDCWAEGDVDEAAHRDTA